jgi:hypothetical protein
LIIKTINEVIEKLTAAILAYKPAAVSAAAAGNLSRAAKAAVWEEKKRTATSCPHCANIQIVLTTSTGSCPPKLQSVPQMGIKEEEHLRV